MFALAVSRLFEDRTGWSIGRFVQTARRYRTVEIHAGGRLLTAADPSPTTYETGSIGSAVPAVPEARTNLSQVGSPAR